MDRQKDKSEQVEQRKNQNPPGQNPSAAHRGADSDKAHLGQSFVTWANAGVLGFHMISGPLLGIFLGYYLDKWLDSSPVCVGIGLALGLVAGALNMYRDMRRILREQAAEDAREKLRRLGRVEEEPFSRAGGDNGEHDSASDSSRAGDNDDDYSDPSSGYGPGEDERK